MGVSNLIVSFSDPSSTGETPSHGYVKLVEGEIEKEITGLLTKFQAVQFMSKLLFGGTPPQEKCYTSELKKIVYAYPSRNGMSFRMGISRGTIVGGIIERYKITELVQVNLEVLDYADNYPGSTVKSIWEGDLYTEDGEDLITEDTTIPAYGTQKVTYEGWRWVYNVTITVDESLAEDSIQCLVYAVWDSGVTGLEISVPSAFEEQDCNTSIPDGYTPPGSKTEAELELEGEKYISGEDSNHNVNWCEFPNFLSGTFESGDK